MADYYSPTVVEPNIPLADMTPLEQLLLSQIFDFETVGDALYFYEEQSPQEVLWFDLGEVRDAFDQSQAVASRTNKLVADALAKLEPDNGDLDLDLSAQSWEFLFQDIIRRSATLSYVTITTSFTCSKMRPDGFGGMVMVITADQVLSSSTSETLCELLDRAIYGELACAPGHGDHIVLRLSEEEERPQRTEISRARSGGCGKLDAAQPLFQPRHRRDQRRRNSRDPREGSMTIPELFVRAAEGLLAARVDDLAWLAVPCANGCRMPGKRFMGASSILPSLSCSTGSASRPTMPAIKWSFPPHGRINIPGRSNVTRPSAASAAMQRRGDFWCRPVNITSVGTDS